MISSSFVMQEVEPQYVERDPVIHYQQLLIVEDVNILQLKSARGEPTKLDQFGSVEGMSSRKRSKSTAKSS